MTTLLVILVAAAGAGAVVQRARQGGLGRRAVKDHHKVLHTLHDISTRSADTSAAAGGGDPAHKHVRVLRAGDAAAPENPVAPENTAVPGKAVLPGGAALPESPIPPESPALPEDAALSESPVLPGGGAADRAAPPAEPDPAPVRPAPELAGHGAPEATDAGGGDTPTPLPQGVPAVAGARARRRRQLAHSGRIAGGRRSVVAVVAAAVVAVAAALAAVLATGIGSRPGPSATPRPSVASHPTSTAPPPTSAPTTLAPSASLVSATSQAAVYSLNGPATIIVSAANGPCWLEVRSGDQSGSVVFAGRLDPGQSRTMSGSTWLRLGNPPAVRVAVDGTAITAPGLSSGQPYDLQFR